MVRGPHNEPHDPFALILGLVGALVAVALLLGSNYNPPNVIFAFGALFGCFIVGFGIGAILYVAIRFCLDRYS